MAAKKGNTPEGAEEQSTTSGEVLERGTYGDATMSTAPQMEQPDSGEGEPTLLDVPEMDDQSTRAHTEAAAKAQGDGQSLNDLMQVGIAAAQAGDKVTANTTFHTVVDRYPDVPEAWVWLAGTTPSLDEAESAFQTALKLEPSNHEAQLGLRWVALRKRVTGSLENALPAELPMGDTAASSLGSETAKGGTSSMMKVLKSPAFISGLLVALGIIAVVLWVMSRGR